MHTATGPSSAAGSASATGSSSVGGPPLADPGFAGLLATMAANPRSPEPPFNDGLLADDVASISYEHALRSHARVRPRNPDPTPLSKPAARSQTNMPVASLKTASITIRLSEPECAQLRRRASEAGMTVSAYLRSCTLEVESLRAQVKQTLAEMRNNAPSSSQEKIEPRGRGIFLTFLARLWKRCGVIARRKNLRLNPLNPFAPVGD